MNSLTVESLKFNSIFPTLGRQPKAWMGLCERLHSKGLIGNAKLKVWRKEPGTLKPESES